MHRHHKEFSREDIYEAREYYLKEAVKNRKPSDQKSAIMFLSNFEIYYRVHNEKGFFKKEFANAYHKRANLIRVEGMIERYLKLKEMGLL